MKKKILVVNMNYLGDALMTTPALAALRRAYPDARIDTVVGAGPAADVLQGNPDVNQIIPRTAKGSFARCRQVFTLLRQGKYTDVVMMPPIPAYAFTAFLARTPIRVGQSNRGMDKFLTHLQHSNSVHMADKMLDTVPVPLTARPDERRLIVHVSDDSRKSIALLLAQAGIKPTQPLLIVNVGATRPQKRWTPEAFAATLDNLTDLPTVIIGAGEIDQDTAAKIVELVQRAKPINLVGRTTVAQMTALLARCDVLLSADSGPMHLATAVGTPTVALFGSTDPDVTGPYDSQSTVITKRLSCSPCNNHPTCEGRFDCMKAITPEEVTLAIRSQFRSLRGSMTSLPFLDVPLDVRETPERT